METNLQRLAILLARVLAYIDVREMSSGRHVSLPAVVEELVTRYKFQKYPKTLQELDVSRGLEFHSGTSGKLPIDKLTIWDSTLVIENQVSTDSAKQTLEEILQWSAHSFGLQYRPGDIKRFAYVSDVSFQCDASLLLVNPAIEVLCAKTSELLSKIWQEPVQYLPVGVRIGHDPVSRKLGIAPFSIERKGNARFAENRYFSEAPLPTRVHIELLEQFEATIRAQNGTAESDLSGMSRE